MRTLELPAGKSPREWGRIHGESFRGEVGALTDIRVYLCTKLGQFKDRAAVLAAAERHLPLLARYHGGLFEELCGIAEGANRTEAELVVANHYTDLRDLDADPATWVPAEGGCSVIWARTPEGTILAQTWDMHATAIPYVMMLRVPETADAPAAWVLTLTGCLGLAGMNAARVAIAINNLSSLDARVGVVWPAVVRRALHVKTAREARDLVLRSPIGSGHHYLVTDPEEAFAIETSGVLRKVVFTSEQGSAFHHTNHCLDPDVAAASTISSTSTTHERFAWLSQSLGTPLAGASDAWTRMGSQDGWPKSVCTNQATPENPHGTATCGAIACNLDTGEILAQGGLITNVAPERFSV